MMQSKTTLLILFTLFLSSFQELIIPCKTSEQCKSIRCSNGSGQCVNGQCQCPSLKPVNPMTTNTPVKCKTTNTPEK
ncbi:hypothetical protein EUTSA_v10009911mg [Eutrema salsugineum]|uniref:EB domain-containing protein n=1 Tax=Eutrema salsugineum TaxID=72664 RepID=V4L6R0_EUTSA|nr:hypothetical protein EUTSA_v10009911mg [Eutrema salsugineum]